MLSKLGVTKLSWRPASGDFWFLRSAPVTSFGITLVGFLAATFWCVRRVVAAARGRDPKLVLKALAIAAIFATAAFQTWDTGYRHGEGATQADPTGSGLLVRSAI